MLLCLILITLAIILILLLFLVRKTDAGARTPSIWLHSLTGQSMDLATTLVLPWLVFSVLTFLLPLLWRVPLFLMSPIDWVRAPQLPMHTVTRYRGALSYLPNFS